LRSVQLRALSRWYFPPHLPIFSAGGGVRCSPRVLLSCGDRNTDCQHSQSRGLREPVDIRFGVWQCVLVPQRTYSLVGQRGQQRAWHLRSSGA
jgi:hypothetical protein